MRSSRRSRSDFGNLNGDDVSENDSLVDWSAAARLAGRVIAPGPVRSRSELSDLVSELREAAGRAVAPVVAASGLASRIGAEGEAFASLSAVHVVDRAQWAIANAESMSALAGPLLSVGSSGEQAAVSAVATAETAALLALLSTKVLGQFDPYGAVTSGHGGRLLLVAPNILGVGSALGVPAHDFRLWVCLHELTHAAQFRAAPWLADHLRAEIAALAPSMTAAGEPGSVWEPLVRAGRVVRTGYQVVRGTPGASLADAVMTREQLARVDRITAVMALIEGHADVTMDAVGPEVVPSVGQLRAAFDQRRQSPRRGTQVVGRLLGLSNKMAQYREGAVFVRQIVAAVGLDGFSRVWTDPATLPSAREIKDPAQWVRRVHG